jgi:hypothetical protein
MPDSRKQKTAEEKNQDRERGCPRKEVDECRPKNRGFVEPPKETCTRFCSLCEDDKIGCDQGRSERAKRRLPREFGLHAENFSRL